MKGTPEIADATSTRGMAQLLAQTEGQRPWWRREELGPLLRHQLNASVRLDLEPFARRRGPDESSSEAEGYSIQTFADLLAHPNPPTRLLTLTKEFAKAQLARNDGALPREVAAVIYYAAITAAQLRANRRITSLSNSELRRGAAWALRQPWLDPLPRILFEEALQSIEPGTTTGA